MTSEICLMNNLAVVLAADSASTVQYWNGGGTESRYFKGANKIFQLSLEAPVGVMIYNNSALLGVPWEITIKEFRKHLAAKTFNHVRQYADEFFEFVSTEEQFFPVADRLARFVGAAFSIFLSDFDDFLKSDEDKFYDWWLPNRKGLMTKINNSIVSDDEVAELMAETNDDLLEELKKFFDVDSFGTLTEENFQELAEDCILKAISFESQSSGYTGLVFAGFGDKSIFPELASFGFCKFIGKKFVCLDQQDQRVTSNSSAVIRGFAQTSMIDTFHLGIDEQVFGHFRETLLREFLNVSQDVCDKASVNLDQAVVSNVIKDASDRVMDRIMEFVHNEHAQPMRRVLGVLPVDEMAELAETLINLQSMKEKVTKPSETVGGPVDVAVITKSEGLVWIKRKHYFDAELNPRYLKRC